MLVIGFSLACTTAEGDGGAASGVGTTQGGAAGSSGTGVGGTPTGGSAGVGGVAAGAGGVDDGGGGGAASGGAPVGGSAGTAGGAGVSGSGALGGAGGNGGVAGMGGSEPDPDARRLLLRDEGNSSLHYVDLAEPTNNWSQGVPAGRDLQLVGDGRVMIGTDNGYEERSLADGSLVDTLGGFAGTQTAHRLHNGNTLLAGVDWQGETGIVLVEVDGAGALIDTIAYAGYSYVRLVREMGSANFLVTADTVAFEGDRNGNVVWSGTVSGHAEPHAWHAVPLAGGQVLVATGYAASLQRFAPPAETPSLTITGGDPAVNPFFYAGLQVLSNGNVIVTNWQGHGDFGTTGLQLLEYDPLGALVWSWQQDDAYVASLQGVIVLDGLDLNLLHAESPITGQLEPVN